MPHKSTTYYINTFFLKANTLVYKGLDKLQFFKQYKAESKKYFSNLYERDFKTELLASNLHFSDTYISYDFFQNPKELATELIFDKNGVAKHVVANYPPPFYNPLSSAYYGLVCYNHYIKTKDANSLASFWKQVNFLISFSTSYKGKTILPYTIDYDKFGLKAPWYAGLTQALAASLFIRAYDLKPEAVYKEQAKNLLEAMFLPIENGGIFSSLVDGHYWIEEYPSTPTSHALNAYLFCLIGLAEYYAYYKEDVGHRINELFKSLFFRLHLYKYKKYYLHNLYHFQFINISYQGLLIFQLIHLAKLTQKNAFHQLANELNQQMNWSAYYSFYQISRDHPDSYA